MRLFVIAVKVMVAISCELVLCHKLGEAFVYIFAVGAVAILFLHDELAGYLYDENRED